MFKEKYPKIDDELIKNTIKNNSNLLDKIDNILYEINFDIELYENNFKEKKSPLKDPPPNDNSLLENFKNNNKNLTNEEKINVYNILKDINFDNKESDNIGVFEQKNFIDIQFVDDIVF